MTTSSERAWSGDSRRSSRSFRRDQRGARRPIRNCDLPSSESSPDLPCARGRPALVAWGSCSRSAPSWSAARLRTCRRGRSTDPITVEPSPTPTATATAGQPRSRAAATSSRATTGHPGATEDRMDHRRGRRSLSGPGLLPRRVRAGGYNVGLSVFEPRGVYDPIDETKRLPLPADLIGWIRDHPDLESGEPVQLTVAAFPRRRSTSRSPIGPAGQGSDRPVHRRRHRLLEPRVPGQEADRPRRAARSTAAHRLREPPGVLRRQHQPIRGRAPR